MSELRRYAVEQRSRDGWVELGRFDALEEASELALAARAAGAVGIRVWDRSLGLRVWGAEGGEPCGSTSG